MNNYISVFFVFVFLFLFLFFDVDFIKFSPLLAPRTITLAWWNSFTWQFVWHFGLDRDNIVPVLEEPSYIWQHLIHQVVWSPLYVCQSQSSLSGGTYVICFFASYELLKSALTLMYLYINYIHFFKTSLATPLFPYFMCRGS